MIIDFCIKAKLTYEKNKNLKIDLYNGNFYLKNIWEDECSLLLSQSNPTEYILRRYKKCEQYIQELSFDLEDIMSWSYIFKTDEKGKFTNIIQ